MVCKPAPVFQWLALKMAKDSTAAISYAASKYQRASGSVLKWFQKQWSPLRRRRVCDLRWIDVNRV